VTHNVVNTSKLLERKSQNAGPSLCFLGLHFCERVIKAYTHKMHVRVWQNMLPSDSRQTSITAFYELLF